MNTTQRQALFESVREVSGVVAEARNVAAIEASRTRWGGCAGDGATAAAAAAASALAECHGSGGGDEAARRVARVLNPCRLFAESMAADVADVGDIERGLRMAAAKVKAGDMTFIHESLVSQALWLQNIAVDALKMAEGGKRAADVERLAGLAIRAQAAAAKVLSSLAALNAFGEVRSVEVE